MEKNINLDSNELKEYNLEQLICEVISVANIIAEKYKVKLYYEIDKQINNYILVNTNKLRYVILISLQYIISHSAIGAEVRLIINVINQTSQNIFLEFIIKNNLSRITIEDNITDQIPAIEEKIINANKVVKELGGTKLLVVDDVSFKFNEITFQLSFKKGKQLPSILINDDTNDISLEELKKLKSYKILLVEDNFSTAQVTIGLLTQFFGHSVKWIDNGQKAIEILKNEDEKFDVILMDLQLPDLDGFNATREIRKFNKVIPIIALTSVLMPWAYDECIECGMNGFISKPPNIKKLGLMIHNVISNKKEL